jgi:N-methylhydantoinase A/oxoprolinase/acetone carboxylase beta subunit
MGISVPEAALGIHRVVNAGMAEGIRFVSVRRGHDPRRFALVPLGGGGGLHANPLARALQMPRIVVPQAPGVLSALGLLAAPIEHERAVGFPAALDSVEPEALRGNFARLDAACDAVMAEDGAAELPRETGHFADLCYVGQSHHLEVPVDLSRPDPRMALREAFMAAHRLHYGQAVDRPMRIVNLRSVHQARVPMPERRHFTAETSPRPPLRRRIMVEGSAEPVEALVLDRAALAPGESVAGPAILCQPDTTILVEPGWRARQDAAGLLMLERG